MGFLTWTDGEVLSDNSITQKVEQFKTDASGINWKRIVLKTYDRRTKKTNVSILVDKKKTS